MFKPRLNKPSFNIPSYSMMNQLCLTDSNTKLLANPKLDATAGQGVQGSQVLRLLSKRTNGIPSPILPDVIFVFVAWQAWMLLDEMDTLITFRVMFSH